MPVLPNFERFGALHWETGAVAAALAYQGLKAPHTGEPYSEAMLLGLSRGIGALYFSLGPAGYFFFSARQVQVGGDALADLCRRLGVTHELTETTDPGVALRAVTATVAAGRPAIVWADRGRLPWGWAPTPAGPSMAPVLVYGVDGNMVHVADRARVPLTCTLDELLAAAGAQPGGMRKVLTLGTVSDSPDLREAVVESVQGCVDGLMKGRTPNFGLSALSMWAEHLLNDWPTYFPTDRLLFENLVRAYLYIELEGTGGGAARPQYADFLDEAAAVTARPDLSRAARLYRNCGKVWTQLAQTFVPDYLRRVRDVLLQREARFRGAGLPGLEESNRLQELADLVDLPDADGLLNEAHRLLLQIRTAEHDAATSLLSAIG